MNTTLPESPNTNFQLAAPLSTPNLQPAPALNALCSPAPLALALRYVKPTVASRTALPALKCVLLSAQMTNEASSGQFVVTTSNLNATTSAWLAAHVAAPGSIAVPYATLSDLVSRLPQNATLHFEVDSATQVLRVQCDDIMTNIKGLPANDFPHPPAWESGVEIELPGRELKSIVRQVAYAAAADDSRPVLTGVLCEIAANGLAFAAADGFRLSLRAQTATTGILESLRAIVPAQVLHDVEKIVGDDATLALAINATKTHIQFSMPNYRLVASLLEGNFPSVQSLVPNTHATRMVVDTSALGAAVDLALIFAQHAQNLVIVEVTPGESEGAGTLRLAAVSAESGDVRRALPVSVTGAEQKLALNGKFIKEFIESVNTPQIALQFNSAAAPVMFTEVGNPGYTHVLMPMHLSNGK
ncbi:MAG: DNA polymerase III subunit beta [Anaerolineae bacterium]|nr:DNA polymerase III subunit beta [Anaerolineae bacterium]